MTEKFLFKIPFVGDGEVGKTSITQRFIGAGFTGSYLMTIGADFKLKTIVLNDGTEVVLQLWDTAGQARFTSIRSFFYTGSHGIVLVYDVTRPESLENLQHWFAEIQKHASNASLLVLGNKIDLVDQRLVSTEEGSEFSSSISALFAETSAKTGQGIDEAMMRFVEVMVSRLRRLGDLVLTEDERKTERELVKTTVHPQLLDDGEVILFELKEQKT